MFTSTRRLSSVLAILAAASLACVAAIDRTTDAIVSKLRVVRDVMFAPFEVRPPRQPQHYPASTVAPSVREFAHRVLFSRRPTVSPGWRMCAS